MADFWQTREFWETHCTLGGSVLAKMYTDSSRTTWQSRKERAIRLYPELPWVVGLGHVQLQPVEMPKSPTPMHLPPGPEDAMHRAYLSPAHEFVFGLTGDTHLSSQEEKLDELHIFYDLLKAEGVENVYHAGDLDSGEKTYPGQNYEVKHVGFGRHLDYAVENYPKRDGMHTHVISGNHDLTYFKHLGVDILQQMALVRPDIHYLGKYGAYVEIAPGTWMYLLHPDGGGAYAISYRRQQMNSAFLGGTKPHVFASGHDHQSIYFYHRNVHVFGTGCFEGQTLYLKRKNLQPQIGGWIVTMKTDEDGTPRSCKSEFVPFFEQSRHFVNRG